VNNSLQSLLEVSSSYRRGIWAASSLRVIQVVAKFASEGRNLLIAASSKRLKPQTLSQDSSDAISVMESCLVFKFLCKAHFSVPTVRPSSCTSRCSRPIQMMRSSTFFGLLVLQVLLSASVSFAGIGPVATLEISNANVSPDGFTRAATVANGQLEAPLITGAKVSF
jgi:hypothetical protein